MRKIKSFQKVISEALCEISPAGGIDKTIPIIQMPKKSAHQLNEVQVKLIQAKSRLQNLRQYRVTMFKKEKNYFKHQYLQ